MCRLLFIRIDSCNIKAFQSIFFFASISRVSISSSTHIAIVFSVLSALQQNIIIIMRFSTSTILAVAATPILVAAQGGESNGSNPFNIPMDSLNTEAGQSVDLTWKPTTEGTVTIYLRSGASNNLNKGTPIACMSTLSYPTSPTY